MISRVALAALVVFLAPAGTRAARDGLELLRRGDAAGAEARFRAALAAEDDAEVAGLAGAHLRTALHNNLGLARLAQEDPAGAANAFDSAAAWSAIDTVTALAAYNSGTALARAERWDAARDRLVNALLLDPGSDDSRHNLEIVLRRLQRDARQSQQPPEPTEFARRLKAEADRLIRDRRYAEALALMQDGLRRDSTVAAFDDFVGRLGEVVGILSADTSVAPGR
jgi:tetratricopeptide (TPR) repeat protein